MLAPKAILSYRSSTIVGLKGFPKFRFSKVVFFPESSFSPRLSFSGESACRGKALWRWREELRAGTMAGSIRVPAFGAGGTGDEEEEEDTDALEQEAFATRRWVFASDELESTLNDQSKWLIATLFSAVLVCRHDAEALWAAMGSVLNAGLSTALKQILNQERPVSNLRADPGMPSSHAQSIFYCFLFAVISIIQYLGVNGFTILLCALTFAFGSYLSWLRVSQQLHTINQVIVGSALGLIFSMLWFWSWNAFVLKAFITYSLVRTVVTLGAIGFWLGFVTYVIQYWFKDETYSL